MFELTFKELVARKRRLLSTVFAVLLGVGLMAGTLVFNDTMVAAGDSVLDIASGNAVDLRATRHIGGVGWRAILYRHIVGAAAAVVRHHDLIG